MISKLCGSPLEVNYCTCTSYAHVYYMTFMMYMTCSNQFYQGNFVVKQSREGTETRTKAVVAGGEVVASGLGHDNSAFVSDAV